MAILVLFILPLTFLAIPLYLAYKNKQHKYSYLIAGIIVAMLEYLYGTHQSSIAPGLKGIAYIGYIFIGSIGAITIALITFGIFLTEKIKENKDV